MADDARRSQPPPKTAQAILGRRALGIGIALCLAGLGLAGLQALQTLLDRPNEAVVRTIPDVLAIWREEEPSALFWAFLLIITPPLALIPNAFGTLHRQPLPRISARTRWAIVAVSALLVVAGVGVGAVFGRAEVAVATPVGVSWLKDGKVREYWSWGAATTIAAACVRRDASGGGDKAGFALNYDVTFPTGREARLVRTPDKLADQVPRLAVLDQRLRATGVPRFTSAEAACLEHYGRALAPAERETLGALLKR
ncbi:hypothetical protein B7G68_17765 [Caulobacter segnis]|uniref:Uncharacterized protein n=2 Tax=Caulobacter segnis TaxID=88688 RepID=D5VN25_CAUST|nr:hypothetical protein [Caulobacter segnis]ADG11898.1 hypothetical protein Cseg_3468 [Caulobacter segnis ATCC 21756]AVQ03528.1 hypothetical protein B7G68_17765 [Caulobacter segnis]